MRLLATYFQRCHPRPRLSTQRCSGNLLSPLSQNHQTYRLLRFPPRGSHKARRHPTPRHEPSILSCLVLRTLRASFTLTSVTTHHPLPPPSLRPLLFPDVPRAAHRSPSPTRAPRPLHHHIRSRQRRQPAHGQCETPFLHHASVQ